jgi:hypothetical protein
VFGGRNVAVFNETVKISEQEAEHYHSEDSDFGDKHPGLTFLYDSFERRYFISALKRS